jgi:hypothetical protein
MSKSLALLAVTALALASGCTKPALPSVDVPDPNAIVPDVAAPDAPAAPEVAAPDAPAAPSVQGPQVTPPSVN